MIVYGVAWRFLPLKEDAETYRKAQGYTPRAVKKITINNREDLADFLNAVLDQSGDEDAAQGIEPVRDARSGEDDRTDVPEFVREDWRRRASYGRET